MKIKNILALLGGAAALLTTTSTFAFAAETSVNATLMNTEFQAEQGSDFTTTIYVPANSNISDFAAVLNYNSDCVELVEAKSCESEKGTIIVNDKNGKLHISFSGTDNQTEKINVAELKFHVIDEIAGGKYDFISIDSSRNNTAYSNTENGKFTDYKITTDFTSLDVYQFGDSNLDGDVKIVDVTYLKQGLVKMRELTDLEWKYSNTFMDYEEDGETPKVNSRDAMLIQQKIAEMDVNLGNRVNVTFHELIKDTENVKDREYAEYVKKSVMTDNPLNSVPAIPEKTGYGESMWSLSPTEYVEVDFSKITKDTDVYAYYAEEDDKVKLFRKVVAALDEGFTQSGKYIADDFQLPYKSNFGSFNMLSSKEFSGLDIIWSIDSGTLAESVNISKEYVVDVPELDYTTWVTFTANIYFNGEKYGIQEFKREIKGTIDLPGPEVFSEVIANIPADIPEHYRLPGYMTLESSRTNYSVNLVQNVDIQWSVIKNSDGSTADERVLDSLSNEIIYLKDETNVTLQADFVFDGNVVYTDRISRTIPEKSIEGQIEYAEQYIQRYVPSVISGETYFPTTVPLYDLTVSWIPDIESGKVEIGANENVNGTIYKIIDVGEKAGYMEWAKAYANVERNGDRRFTQTGLEFDVQLAGNSSEITTDKIPDVNLYKALVNIFDNKYGNKDGILTEEEIYDADVMEKLNYTVDLSGKKITNISGIKYLKNYRKIDLSNNDLGGTNASLSDLESMNRLEQISLSNCNISEIPDSVFASKHLIEGIDLSYNKLKDVNFLALKDSRTHVDCAYSELKELFLQGNYITDISNLAFVNDQGETVSRIPSVNVLTLSRDLNYFEYTTGKNLGKKVLKEVSEYEYDITASMDITPLGYLKNVTTLWLANNYITDISPLENCKLLATLDLSGNSIVATAKQDGLAPISKLQSLVCLKLDNNADIQTVKSLKRLIYLDTLSLSNNNIGNVSGIIDSMKCLTYLDLDNNSLTTFDASCFPLLKRLYLENNGVRTDDGSLVEDQKLSQVQNLSSAVNLVELRLNGNNVDRATISSIGALTKLEYLSLSGNTVVDLDFLNELTSLHHLELARCGIRQNRIVTNVNSASGEATEEKIDNMSYISALTNIKILDLSDNEEITDISALSTLTNIGVFYANNLKIEDASALRSMTKLQYLSMQNSGIKNMSFLNTLNLLQFLNLSGHCTDAFDFRNLQNHTELFALFLDSASGTEAINLKTLNTTNLEFLTLANMKVSSVENIPDMDNINYLGLRNTNINDFNGPYSENDGYIYPITRFSTVKYIDVADNPELFTKKNLEMLYDFVGDTENRKSIILYRNNAPEGYIPGLMDPKIEAQVIKNDIDFGEGGADISAAMGAGYHLQSTLNGYDLSWNIDENEYYHVKDGKLYFKNTGEINIDTKFNLGMDILGLYYRPENSNTNPSTPIKFTASIQTTTKKVDTGKDKLVKTEWTTSSSNTLSGWTLDSSKTEYGNIKWGDWTSWSKNAVTANELRQVETDKKLEYTDWGNWSGWSNNVVTASNTREVQTRVIQEPYNESIVHYYPACSSSQKSFVDGLKEIGVYASTVSDRRPIAEKNGISNYQGSYEQNMHLLNLLKNGQLYDWTETVTKYNDITQYSYRDRSQVNVTYYRYRDGVKVPSVYHFYRDIYEDVYEDVISGMTLVVEK